MNTLGLQATAKLNQWWKPKATNLLAVFYIVIVISGLSYLEAFWLFLLSVITILGIGSFGHLVNDWYDIEFDLAAGKPNRLATMPVWQRRAVVGGALATALLPWVFLPFDRFSILLLALEFGLLLGYAIPPLRFKERKIWPIIVDGAYAYAVPAVLAAYTFFLADRFYPNWLFLGVLFFWQITLGIRHFLNHLALDRVHDLKTHTHTLATEKGNRFIHNLVRKLVFPLETIAFMGFLIIVGSYDLPLAAITVGLWGFLSSLPLILTIGREYSVFSYRFSHTTMDRFYQNWWPLVPLFILFFKNWPYGVLLIGHVVIFRQLRSNFLLPVLSPVKWILYRYLIYWPSYLLVASYYLLSRKITGKMSSAIQPSDQAHGASAPPSRMQKVVEEPEKKFNIAVVNINRSKYTETFVWNLVPRLPFKVFYLYGGELPQYDHDHRHFLSDSKMLRLWADFLETLFNLGKDYYLKQSIAGYLQARKIEVVLAEFGPVGVQLLPITRDLGIPLVVNFHGYDIFHREALLRNAESYQELFKEAHRIIGVSEIMLEHLGRLGAPKEKLVHLPAYVNLDLFPYRDHSLFPPRFLAVGRFAETKSPHLTILAFNKVREEIPEATLTMIGKGGGGELFEACLILVKALGIEKSVDFKGVLTHEEVAGEMARARVFVQHSVTTPEYGDMEGKPVALMEAMAAGLPIVATLHSGIKELIEHEKNGLLIPEYDVQAMAEAMILLAQNDELTRRIGKKASERIREDPLIHNHIGMLKEIIESCL